MKKINLKELSFKRSTIHANEQYQKDEVEIPDGFEAVGYYPPSPGDSFISLDNFPTVKILKAAGSYGSSSPRIIVRPTTETEFISKEAVVERIRNHKLGGQIALTESCDAINRQLDIYNICSRLKGAIEAVEALINAPDLKNQLNEYKRQLEMSLIYYENKR